MRTYGNNVGKILATIALVFLLILFVGLLFVMLPLFLAAAYMGKGKPSALAELIPVAAVFALIWKIWKPETVATKGRATTTVEKTVIIPTTASDYDRQFASSLDRYHKMKHSEDIPF